MCKNCANILDIPQILNFTEEHSSMPIYKTLEKFNSKYFMKRIHSPIGVLTSLGVAIFRVTLHDRAQIK